MSNGKLLQGCLTVWIQKLHLMCCLESFRLWSCGWSGGWSGGWSCIGVALESHWSCIGVELELPLAVDLGVAV